MRFQHRQDIGIEQFLLYDIQGQENLCCIKTSFIPDVDIWNHYKLLYAIVAWSAKIVENQQVLHVKRFFFVFFFVCFDCLFWFQALLYIC